MRGSRTIMGLFISCVAASALFACTDALHDGAGGADSSGATTDATSTSTTASTGAGATPCVLDSSKLGECTLQ